MSLVCLGDLGFHPSTTFIHCSYGVLSFGLGCIYSSVDFVYVKLILSKGKAPSTMLLAFVLVEIQICSE